MVPLAGVDVMVIDGGTSESLNPEFYNGEADVSLLRYRKTEDTTETNPASAEVALPVDTFVTFKNEHDLVQDGKLQFNDIPAGRY
jgi:hypothetical protein